MRWMALLACAGFLTASDWTVGPTLPATGVERLLALRDGGALVVTGDPYDRTSARSVWRLDPARSSWRQLGTLPAPAGSSATVLTTGVVMFAGGGDGWTGPKSGQVWLYDPQADAWTQGTPMSIPRAGHVLLPLLGGGAFAYGGLHDFHETDQAGQGEYEMYDTPPERTVAAAWEPLPPPYQSAAGASAVTLPDGWAIVSEGDPSPNSGATGLGATSLVPPDGHALVATWNAPAGLGGAVLAPLADGGALVIGGNPIFAPWPGTVDVYVLERATATWIAGPPALADIDGGSAVLLDDGHVLLAASDATGAQTVEELDPAALTWSDVEPPPEGRSGWLLRLADGTILSMADGPTALRAPTAPAGLEARFSCAAAAYVTRADPLRAHLHFNAAVSGLTGAAFATDNVTTLALSGSGADYDLTIAGGDDGWMNVALPAGSVRDAAGRANAALVLRRLVDRDPPTLAIGEPTLTGQLPSLYWRVGVSADAHGELTADAVRIRFTGTLGGTVHASGSEIRLDGLAGAGTVSIAIASGVMADAAGNVSPATPWTAPYEVDVAASPGNDGGADGGGTVSMASATAASESDAAKRCGVGSGFALLIGAAFVRRRQRAG